MHKIRKGDDVIVRVGKNRGKRGAVQQVYPNGRVLVDGINIVKKHVRPNPQKGVSGGIVEEERPIQISNVGLYNPTTEKADRVGIRRLDDGTKVRYFKGNGEVIDSSA